MVYAVLFCCGVVFLIGAVYAVVLYAEHRSARRVNVGQGDMFFFEDARHVAVKYRLSEQPETKPQIPSGIKKAKKNNGIKNADKKKDMVVLKHELEHEPDQAAAAR